MKGVSDSVLEALARALQLDEAERAHLFDLARAVRPMRPPRRRRAPRKQARPSIQHMLDAVTGAAAFVHNARLDNMATNELARALYSDMFGKADGPGPVNSARMSSSTPGRATSTPTGSAPPATSSPFFGRRPAASRPTATYPTSSASSPRRAPSSAPAGPPTTSASTTPASRTSTTPSSATSASPTTEWSSLPTPDWRSRSTQRSPTPGPPRRSASSEAGPQHSTRRSPMQITPNGPETAPGPSDWFTGDVYIDTIATATAPSRLAAASVHFAPRRANRLAHTSLRPDDPCHRGARTLPASRGADRGDPPGRHRLLRAQRGPLARSGT